MRKYKIKGYLTTWAKNEKEEWYSLKEEFYWDDITKPFYPPYSKDPMEFLGFDDIHFKAKILFQGKESNIYFGDSYSNHVGSNNIYPKSEQGINYFLRIEEDIIDPKKLDNMVFEIIEIGKFGGAYAREDFNQKSTLEIIEGKPIELPETKLTLEVFDIKEDKITLRLGYRVDISSMYTVTKDKEILYQDSGSEGRYSDFSAWDITVRIRLKAI